MRFMPAREFVAGGVKPGTLLVVRSCSNVGAGTLGKPGAFGFGPSLGAGGLLPHTGGGGLPPSFGGGDFPSRGGLLFGPGCGSCGGAGLPPCGGRFPPYGCACGTAFTLAPGGGFLKGGAAGGCFERGCEA